MAEEGGLSMSTSKSECDTSSNEERSEEVENLGNKRMATRTPNQV
jgi:hypothetical protein